MVLPLKWGIADRPGQPVSAFRLTFLPLPDLPPCPLLCCRSCRGEGRQHQPLPHLGVRCPAGSPRYRRGGRHCRGARGAGACRVMLRHLLILLHLHVCSCHCNVRITFLLQESQKLEAAFEGIVQVRRGRMQHGGGAAGGSRACHEQTHAPQFLPNLRQTDRQSHAAAFREEHSKGAFLPPASCATFCRQQHPLLQVTRQPPSYSAPLTCMPAAPRRTSC